MFRKMNVPTKKSKEFLKFRNKIFEELFEDSKDKKEDVCNEIPGLSNYAATIYSKSYKTEENNEILQNLTLKDNKKVYHQPKEFQIAPNLVKQSEQSNTHITGDFKAPYINKRLKIGDDLYNKQVAKDSTSDSNWNKQHFPKINNEPYLSTTVATTIKGKFQIKMPKLLRYYIGIKGGKPAINIKKARKEDLKDKIIKNFEMLKMNYPRLPEEYIKIELNYQKSLILEQYKQETKKRIAIVADRKKYLKIDQSHIDDSDIEGKQKNFRTQLCRFYLNGICSKGKICSYSHNPSKFPCVAFHIRKKCFRKNCVFSHDPNINKNLIIKLQEDENERLEAKKPKESAFFTHIEDFYKEN